MKGQTPPRAPGRAGTRDQVHVNLLGQSALLREYAAKRGVAVGMAIRDAISRMLEADAGVIEVVCGDVDKATHADAANAREKDRVLLRMPASQCARLARRAGAAGMSRSQYVMALMAGEAAPSMPENHDAMVAALTASTAAMATQWVDLNHFLRLLAHDASAELAPLLVELRALPAQVRAHLVLASGLLAELEKSRRYQR
jgi:hypothetical protein